MRYKNGTITVFLSLIGVLFLSLICMLVESARVQGARAKASAITDMGLFSAFGEYEGGILEEFDVLFLDGAYGDGEFKPEKISERIRHYMELNVKDRAFNLFPVALKECRVPAYALATDENGEVFYQEAVESQKEMLAGDLLQEYRKRYEEAKKQEEQGQACEEDSRSMEEEITRLQEGDQQKDQQEAGDEGESEKVENPHDTVPQENPLEVIKKIKELGILALVMKNPEQVSEKTIDQNGLPSKRNLNKGNLRVEKKHKGMTADGIFLEYLKNHFKMYPSHGEKGLSYELEYLVIGKESDRENLKGIVNRLLLMREGSNFLYLMGNEEMKQQAMLLAAALAGPAAIPGLVTAVKMALLLAWAYGESLLDVRMLLAGGKIPAVKTPESWKLSLEHLGKLMDLLEECDSGGGEGMSYGDYLLPLLLAGGKSSYPMRALDLIEERIRSQAGMENFRMDTCIAKAEARVEWELKPVFLRIPHMFLGTGNVGNQIYTAGSFGY